MNEVDGGVLSERALRRLRWSYREWQLLRRVVAVALWFAGVLLLPEFLHLGVWAGGGPRRNGPLDVATIWRHDGAVPAIGGAVGVLLAVAVAGQLARLVDYRWFDAFCVLIPLYNLWWSARIAWRLTYKLGPTRRRDWPPASVREPSWPDAVVRRIAARTA